MRKVPIRNIYYLLCYAWDFLGERDLVSTGLDGDATLLDLLARVLTSGVSRLLRKGIDRGYVATEGEIPGIKGRVLINESLRRDLFRRGRAQCEFDEFHHDVLHNQIIKTTLERLLKVPGLDPKIRDAVHGVHTRLHGVSTITLSPSVFRRVVLHRNNSFYKFLLHVCELVHGSTLPDEQGDGYLFRNFLEDEMQMAHLFEEFVRNFYRVEQTHYRVERRNIEWQLTANDPEAMRYLPKMQTDITLESKERTIIIETKYYHGALERRTDYGTEKFRSDHLRQLMTYVECYGDPCDGVLLYPSAGESICKWFDIKSGRGKVCIRTVDLSAEWREIRGELLGVVGE